MKRLTLLLLVWSLVAGLAGADDRIFIAADRIVGDAERNFKLESGASGAGNWEKLQTPLNGTTQFYPFNFGGKVWRFDKTPVVTRGGRRFLGNGRTYPDKGHSPSEHVGNPSVIAWGGGTITFDGDSVSASTSGTSATITVEGDGVQVQDEDVLHTVEITNESGGWTKGWYHILSVDEGENTYTLDRNCCSGESTGMTGRKKGTAWRDSAFGNVYEGLNFSGTANYAGTPSPTNRAAIGLHVQGLLKGETVIRDSTFANFDVAILFGKGLAAFDPDFDNGDLSAVQDFDGEASDQADLGVVENVILDGCKYGIVMRCGQSIAHTIRNVYMMASPSGGAGVRETMIYAERGGKFRAENLWASSGFVNGPTVLRVGGSGGSVASTIEGPIVIDTVVLDAPSPTVRLLDIDQLGNATAEITFANVKINSNNTGTNRSFNGTTLTASATADSKTITIEGASAFTPAENDKCLLLGISGGTGFIPGTYRVVDFHAGNKTWTLDRICSTGSATGMTGGTVNGRYHGPLVTIHNGIHLVLENVSPITPGTIKLLAPGGNTFKGSITLRNCGLFIGNANVDRPQVVIDDSSTEGRPVKFEGCWLAGSFDQQFCRDGVWVTDDDYGTHPLQSEDGWQKPNVYELEKRLEEHLEEIE